MNFLSRLLGNSKNTIKRDVARELGGVPVKAPAGHRVIVSRLQGWDVLFDIDTPERPPTVIFAAPPATRVGILFTTNDDFFLELTRRRIVGQAFFDRRMKHPQENAAAREAAFKELQPHLRPPEVALGYGEFDYEFSIETNDEEKVRQLLADRVLRGVLQDLRSVHVKVAQGDPWMELLVHPLPERVAVLYFQAPYIMKYTENIRAVHRLVVALMERLVAMGSASPAPVGLFAPHG